jgi:hypothetical protein
MMMMMLMKLMSILRSRSIDVGNIDTAAAAI